MKNKKAVDKAIKKARAWFGRDDLVTEPRTINWTPPEAVVEIGEILELAYLSDKFTGKPTAYKHIVVKPRNMMISPDGSTIIIDPPFKVTKRGIEG